MEEEWESPEEKEDDIFDPEADEDEFEDL